MIATLLLTCAVTYDLFDGRFAERAVNYLHAKWISYKTGMPLLYKPFLYSDEFVLHDCESQDLEYDSLQVIPFFF